MPDGDPGRSRWEAAGYFGSVVNENKKRIARAGVLLLGLVLPLLASPVAHAARRDDGDDPGEGLSVFETLGLFVVTPIVLFALIAGLVVLGERSGRKQDTRQDA